MRVLIVTTWYPTVTSPVSGIFIRKDAEILARSHDVRVLHLTSPAHLSDADEAADREHRVPVTRVPMSTGSPRQILSAWPRIESMLRDADVLHTHAFSTLLPFAMHRVPVPWVHSEHWSGIGDPASLTSRGRAVLRVTAPLLRRPDVVTAVSAYLGDRVRAYRRGLISIVPPAVRAANPVPPPADPSSPALVSVGGLVEGKDPFLALATVRELHRRGVSARATWIGGGPLADALRGEIRGEDAFTLAGPMDAAGVGAALDASDIFLLPTRGETLCLSALEAITHGRPVVIGDRGGPREYIEPANGRLVSERTPEAYADAVEDVWRRREEFDPFAVAATIGTRYTPESVLAGYDRAYADAAAARSRRGGVTRLE